MVLQKYIAQSGFCSRRQAEEHIRAGRVFVNGKVAELGQEYREGDEVVIGKYEIGQRAKLLYIAANKPEGFVCTNAKFKGEQSVFELLPDKYHGIGLFVVGRLDKDSRGLVIFTNDGDWANKMTHPRYGHEKEYVIKISNTQCSMINDKELISNFKKGVDIGEDGVAKVKDIEYLGEGRFRIVLTEGKKRQIRRMFGVFKLGVEDLCRVRIGSVELSGLKEGDYKEIRL